MHLSKTAFFKRIFATTSLIAILISISGCGKKDESTATPISPTSSNQPVASIASANIANVKVDGYKAFKFGMTPVQIVKLPECVASYKNLIDSAKDTITRIDERYQVQEEIVQTKVIITKLENFDESLIAEWLGTGLNIRGEVQNGFCSVEFMGEQHALTPNFETGKLVSISIGAGNFTNEKFQALHKALAEKYGSTISPTAEQIASFNNNSNSFGAISATYAANQVALSVMKIGSSREITIAYLDASKAASVNKQVTKGQVKTGDL